MELHCKKCKTCNDTLYTFYNLSIFAISHNHSFGLHKSHIINRIKDMDARSACSGTSFSLYMVYTLFSAHGKSIKYSFKQ